MTMLDWEEGRTYEIAPGMTVRILTKDVQFPLNWYVEKRLCPQKKLLLAYIAENSTGESKQFFESLDAWQRCPAQ